MNRTKTARWLCAMAALLAMATGATPAHAQGVTTGAVTGVITDVQGGVVPGVTVTATHVPSGTTYESVTQGDGRFFMPGMRVGGPYKVRAMLSGFGTESKDNVSVGLGVSTDLEFKLRPAAVNESITVTANFDPVFSSNRTGAATSVSRFDLATLPTISGRIADITRLTPQSSGSSFAGQDTRMNNITVDGAYFNNSFGLRNAPGDTSGVAPISLEAIEQVQVSVAPFDVRQGNFVGAGVNTVTRSGTNRLTGSVYHRFRNESFVGTEAAGLAFNPGVFNTRTTGGWAGGPIVMNKLFVFGNFENYEDTRPLSTFRANRGGEPVGGSVTRVLASDLTALSSFLSSRFNYETGVFENVSKLTPGKPFLIRADYNLNTANKVSFRYNQLSSSSGQILSSSSSLGNSTGRSSGTNTTFLSFQNSNYSILENIRPSAIAEWNSIIGNRWSNTLLGGYTKQDESRGDPGTLFPFVDILDGSGVAYTSFGSEPFTPNNELRYNTFQLQDSVTKFGNRHSLTFGGAIEKYNSENVFFPGKQSAYVYRTLADFYTDVNGFLANPNRTTSPITLQRFQVRYSNIPGQDKPVQPLAVLYGSAYVQDEWRPKSNVTVSMGLRFDMPVFGDTAYENTKVDALTFRDETGAAVKYSTGKLPDPKPLWSPRVGFNWDVNKDQKTQVRGGTGIFTGKPAYVWVSNQIGNTGVLTGFIQEDGITTRPFNPNPDTYKPTTVTGAPATSVDLAVTDPAFSFPQLWRSNIAVDRRLPGGLVATGEFIYNRDVNGIYYINANLPAAQSAFVGADNRPRWVGTSCAAASSVPCVTRLNNAPGNQITNAIVLKNQNVGRSWNAAGSLSKTLSSGFSIKSAYSYGKARNTVDPGSIASGSFTSNAINGDPNNPALGYSSASPGHRVFLAASFSRSYFNFGATTVSAFLEARTIGNTSYTFSGDMNGDSAGNDLIYIPRDQSEMNFSPFTLAATGRLFTAAEQAAAWDAYIAQDNYLSKHRGEHAQRGAVFLPLVKRMDLSLSQDVFHSVKGQRHSGQIRLDVTNFGNLLNHKWGVSQRIIQNQILTNAAVDAQGRSTYRMAIVNNALPTTSLQTTTFASDVYTLMLSFRYTFN